MTTGMTPAPESSTPRTAFAFLRPLPSSRSEDDVAEARPPVVRDRWDRLFPSSAGPTESGSSLNVAGLQIGQYLIQDRIGRGGMGAVFRATDLRLDRVVALKILAPDYTRDPACVQRFHNEARAAAKLDHENIARIFSSGEDGGQQYIAFEYVSGTNVRDMIQQRGTLTPAETVNYLLQMVEALRHTSLAGVVHRDIKPSNIIITPSGRAKLVDLGLARHQTPGEEDLTVHGTTLGTFDYISPEQALDPRNVDVRSDLYSLGCTAYHMLTGEPPYNRGSMFQKVLDHHNTLEAPDAASLNPLVPQRLSQIVRRLMASQVDDRYQRPEDVTRDLLPLAGAFGVPVRGSLFADVSISRPFWVEHRGWILAFSLLGLIGAIASLPPKETLPGPASSPAPILSLRQDGITSEPSTPPERTLPGSRPGANSERQTSSEQPPPPVSPRSGLLLGMLQERRSFASLQPAQPAEVSTSNIPLTNLTTTPTITEAAPLSNPAISKEVSFWTLSGNGDGTRPIEKAYATLEAACLAAPDNSTIELRFDGESPPQIPIRVEGKALRIRAANGHRPVLVFEAPGPIGQPVTSRMITVVNGDLEMFDLDLVLRVPSGRPAEQWSVFSMVQAKKLTLLGVSVTLDNSPRQQPAAFFEWQAPSGKLMERMMPDGMRRGSTEVHVSDCLFRGEGDGFSLRDTQDVRVMLSNSAFALSGYLIKIDTQDSQQLASSLEPPPFHIQMQHTTSMLQSGMVNVSVGEAGVAPTVDIRCEGSIVSVLRPDKAMITMKGPIEMDEWLDRLLWEGASNFIDAAGPWCEISAVRSASSPYRKFDIADWGRQWKKTGNTPVSRNVFEQSDVWEKPVFHALPVSAFFLRTSSTNAYKAPEASDGTDAGVDWELPRVPRRLPAMQ